MSRYNGGSVVMHNLAENLISEAGWDKNGTPKNGEWNVTYGFDHACGYFIQFSPLDSDAMKTSKLITGESGGTIDIDSLFNNLSGVKLGYFLRQAKINHEHEEMCYLDLPF